MTVLQAKLARVDISRSQDRRLCERIAATALSALLAELAAWPKPGLVSCVDNGSHEDMDAATVRKGAAALFPFFVDLAMAGSDGVKMSSLRAIGVRAESAMMAATGGVNTHRGAIFGLGLLCAAAGKAAQLCEDDVAISPRKLGAVVAREWGDDIRRGPIPLHSHGSAMLRRYGAGGARIEAAEGFPSVYRVGLPALRHGHRLAPNDASAAQVQVCFALIAAVRDTNVLHRGGAEGARYATSSAVSFLADGGIGLPDWRARAEAVHDEFVARRLSPGGCADLLAMTLFVDALEGGTALAVAE